MRVYLLNDRGVNCLCEAFMPLLHHASSRLNSKSLQVQACFMVSYNRIGINVVPS